MKNDNKQLKVKRIKKADTDFVEQFNSILKKGIIWEKQVVWDINEGNKFLSQTDNILLVAYWKGQMAGFLTAHRLQGFDKNGVEVFIYDVGVHKSFRQKGIGKALIDEVKTWAKEQGAHEIWALTNRSNPAAISLYESTGGIEDKNEPDLMMFTYKINN